MKAATRSQQEAIDRLVHDTFQVPCAMMADILMHVDRVPVEMMGPIICDIVQFSMPSVARRLAGQPMHPADRDVWYTNLTGRVSAMVAEAKEILS